MSAAVSAAGLSVVQLGVYPPPHGGIQTNVVAIQERLRAQGQRGFVINLSRHRQSGIKDVFFPESASEVFKLLVTLPAKIAHIHIGGDITNRLVALAAFLTLLPGRKTVFTLHSGGYPTSAAALRARRVRLIFSVLRRFDALIGVNPELRDFLGNSGIAPQKVHLIEPFARLSRVRTPLMLDSRLEAFCASQQPLLLTVGLLEPEYDLTLQFRVLRQLRQSYPGVGLIIVGSGSLQEELGRQIAKEPHNEHILLAGDVPHASTIELIRRTAVLLRTTLYDGDSISVREALQLGTPVVATDNGMRPAGVVLAPIGDAEAVARQVISVLAAPRSDDGAAAAASGAGADGIDEVLALYQSITARG